MVASSPIAASEAPGSGAPGSGFFGVEDVVRSLGSTRFAHRRRQLLCYFLLGRKAIAPGHADKKSQLLRCATRAHPRAAIAFAARDQRLAESDGVVFRAGGHEVRPAEVTEELSLLAAQLGEDKIGENLYELHRGPLPLVCDEVAKTGDAHLQDGAGLGPGENLGDVC